MPDTVSVTAVDAGLTDVAGTSVNRHCVLELAAPNAPRWPVWRRGW
jgi:hypothetical protein